MVKTAGGMWESSAETVFPGGAHNEGGKQFVCQTMS